MSTPKPPSPQKINPYQGMDSNPEFAAAASELGINNANNPDEIARINQRMQENRVSGTYKDDYWRKAAGDLAGDDVRYYDGSSYRDWAKKEGYSSKEINDFDRKQTERYGTNEWHLESEGWSPDSQQLDQINARAYDYKMQDETAASNEAMYEQQSEWAVSAAALAQQQSDDQAAMWESMMAAQQEQQRAQNKDMRIQNRKDARAVKIANRKTMRQTERLTNQQIRAQEKQLKAANKAQKQSDRSYNKSLKQQTRAQTKASKQAARQQAKQMAAASAASAALLASTTETNTANAAAAAEAQAAQLEAMQAQFTSQQEAAEAAQREQMEAMMNQPVYMPKQQSMPVVQKPVARQDPLMPAPMAPSPMSIAAPPAPQQTMSNNRMAIVRTSPYTKTRQRRATRGTSRLTN